MQKILFVIFSISVVALALKDWAIWQGGYFSVIVYIVIVFPYICHFVFFFDHLYFFLVAFAVKDGASWRGGKFDIKLIALHCLCPRPEMMAKNSLKMRKIKQNHSQFLFERAQFLFPIIKYKGWLMV